MSAMAFAATLRARLTSWAPSFDTRRSAFRAVLRTDGAALFRLALREVFRGDVRAVLRDVFRADLPAALRADFRAVMSYSSPVRATRSC